MEYDHVDPRALDHRLALRALPGLFCCGQINGTTGYEEAAGQGLFAGLNAAALALGREPVLADRADSYLGVMIDDLVLQGVTEPYRMLTARAEFRLRLRADNAETRLSPVAAKLGILSDDRLRRLERRTAQRTGVAAVLDRRFSAGELRDGGAVCQGDAVRTGWEWLGSGGVALREIAPDNLTDHVLAAELTEDARYAPYCARQDEEVAKLKDADRILLSDEINFAEVPGLSTEMIERLQTVRPPSLGAAGRIRGVTPAALTAVLLHVRRRAA